MLPCPTLHEQRRSSQIARQARTLEAFNRLCGASAAASSRAALAINCRRIVQLAIVDGLRFMSPFLFDIAVPARVCACIVLARVLIGSSRIPTRNLGTVPFAHARGGAAPRFSNL